MTASWLEVQSIHDPDQRWIPGCLASDPVRFLWKVGRHFDGTSWTQVQDIPSSIYYVMAGTGPDDMVVAGNASVARFDGNQWTQWTAELEGLRILKVASGGDGSFAVIGQSQVGVFDEGAWRYFDFTGEVEFNAVRDLRRPIQERMLGRQQDEARQRSHAGSTVTHSNTAYG